MNDKFRLYWNEYKAIDHELRRTNADYRNGSITDEEYDMAMERMETCGDMEKWEIMNAYETDYDFLMELARGGDKEAEKDLQELKKEIVEEYGPKEESK